MPICNGGCSQKKIDAKNKKTCLYGMTEDEKSKRVIRRLEEIIRMQRLKAGSK